MRFADPVFLVVLLLVPLYLYLYWWNQIRGRRKAAIRYSDLGLIRDGQPVSAAVRFRHLPAVARAVGLTLLILGLARPQSGLHGEEVLTEGIDIVLVLDVSGSMKAEDLSPSGQPDGRNRLDAAREVAADFIRGRRNDRIGMVVFSAQSFTQCPLTLDYSVLQTLLQDIRIGMITDGTAIGMAVATAVDRLRDSKAESKVIILLTDGRNNTGSIDPVTAAELARALDIKIYSIGVGGKGKAPYPVDDSLFGRRYVQIPVDIDEETLQRIAGKTGGEYFRATNAAALAEIYKTIDEMEKTEIEVKEFTSYRELMTLFLFPALLLLLGGVGLGETLLRRAP
jgi:Ca-activated chloride channel family protein